MSEKNNSPPHLAAAAEGGEGERLDQAGRQARPANNGEQTGMNNKNSTPQQTQEPRLPHRHSTPHGMLDRTLQAQLGRQLRAIYSDVAEEPVPDRFVRLLEELEAAEKPQ